ncbi:M20 aminoacylase family protein [Ralstonia mannitolilytica]|uniref:M20 aminoacylase family protein n=1 Tax=Ralstonia mannitolilytica TaxID=105219 RepID=UPI0005D84B35|nr:M20 aminoacylase family protein [Ralstonia mannitolilytica]AJW45523.1 peptidase M20 [Ralstonia mannitolilytica]QIF07736.1 amidohydrolase [Ralstonia mannitolilytica]CAJ0723737.1 Hippurate hydrolase [Ralstonia mannitolilytica]CAJ0783914.1 Hippurate hydrolase [Ralstonia mannitolilytica]
MKPDAVVEPVADLLPELVALRRDLHANPELAYEEHRTAGIVAQSLRVLGLEVEEGVGGTGVVGTLRGGRSGRSVGLRADMDALPMVELGRAPHASRVRGRHHGCGHDGHTSMLIGAARQLARTGIDGTVRFIFQPAEEGQAGARRMIEDGLFERFPCDSVYALHNWPDLPLGHAQTRPGPIMAAADRFDITLRGRGGHAAQPHHTPDAILAASQLVAQLHTIVSRRIDPGESAVLSVTRIEGGHSHNVLPAEVRVTGTVRSFDAASQDRIEAALRDTAHGVALASGTQIDVEYRRYYPATINTAAEAQLALDAAKAIGLQADMAPRAAFTSEDFAFMLQQKPGAYLWLGQGRAEPGPDGEYPLHHPCYDFNDDALPLGVRWFCEVARRALAAVPSGS